MILDKYQGIIFDMDGTLVDSMPSHLEAWRLACEYFGYPFDYEYMLSLGGVPTKETVDILNEKYQLQHSAEVVAIKKQQLWQEMTLIPEIIPVTHQIFKHHIGKKPMGIGTGAERSHAEELLSHHQMLDHIDALVTATDVLFGKPHPETFLTVAEIIGVSPSDCIVFEDTEIGYQAATSAGMDCIMVKNGELVIKNNK